MNTQQHRWPLFLRTAIVATALGVVGWFVWAFGAQFVEASENAQLRDTIPMIGSAMMSVCSLGFMLAAILAIAHSTRERRFTLTHGLVIVVAGLVTLAAGIDGAYPR